MNRDMNKKFHFPMTGKKAAWMIAAGVTLAGLESGAPPLGARHEVVQPVAITLRVQQINPTTVENNMAHRMGEKLLAL